MALALQDYTVSQTWSDQIKHRVRLPGYFRAWAAKFLYERAPREFDVEQIGVDVQGEQVFVLFWHAPN